MSADPPALDAATVARLQDALEEILADHPEGLNEHHLFKVLAQAGEATFRPRVFDSPLALFQAHFILFHALHHLRRRLWRKRRGDLKIGCLTIKLEPYVSPDTTLPSPTDTLDQYYLNLDNLRDTTAEDVEGMLDAFWRRYEAHEGRHEALRVLGLEEPVDFATIKRRYRELALEHHSDRGGDDLILREINAAMEILRRAAGK